MSWLPPRPREPGRAWPFSRLHRSWDSPPGASAQPLLAGELDPGQRLAQPLPLHSRCCQGAQACLRLPPPSLTHKLCFPGGREGRRGGGREREREGDPREALSQASCLGGVGYGYITVLTISSLTQWHLAHSQRCATITTIYSGNIFTTRKRNPTLTEHSLPPLARPRNL